MFKFTKVILLAPLLGQAMAARKLGKPGGKTTTTTTCAETIKQATESLPKIDGRITSTEWEGATKFDLHQASSTNMDILAKAHVLATCTHWYVAVTAYGDATAIWDPENTGEAFLKLNGQIPDLVQHVAAADGSGWEAKYAFPKGSGPYELKIHTNVDKGGSQTAGTPGQQLSVCFTPDCALDAQPTEPQCGDDAACQPGQPDMPETAALCQVYYCDAGTCAQKDAADGLDCGFDGDVCTHADTCQAGKCHIGGFKPSGHMCGGDMELLSECNIADTCDGNGNCVEKVAEVGTSCSRPEDDHNKCTEYTCTASGTCEPDPVPDGSPCGESGDMCTFADSCSNGVCTFGGYEKMGVSCFEAAAEGETEVTTDCNRGMKCDGSGSCKADHQETGQTCEGPPGEVNECVEYTCTASGTCESEALPDGSSCGPSVDPCMKPWSCSAGECVVGDPKDKGMTCGDQATSSCDKADTCDGAGQCVENLHPVGASCNPPDRMDDNDCIEYQCSLDGKCVAVHLDDGTECGAEPASCMKRATCSVGVCQAPKPMDKGDSCGVSNESACDKADTCDGNGNCQKNWLEEGTSCSVPNDTTDACTVHQCDATGSCAPVKLPDGPLPDGSSCDKPGDMCTFADSCSDGVCAFGGYEKMGVSCFEATFEGAIETTNSCNGGKKCDGHGKCQADLEAAGSTCAPDKEDSNKCVEYKCTESGMCESVALPDGLLPDGSSCGPSVDPCMKPWSCSAGECVVGDPKDKGMTCGDQATSSCDKADTCDGAGQCVENFHPVGASCNPTDGVDECHEYKCTESGTCEAVPLSGTDCGPEPEEGSCMERQQCSVGVCQDPEPTEEGVSCGDDTDSCCNKPNTCDGKGTCQENFVAALTSCTPEVDDGNECTEYKCTDSGTCEAVNKARGVSCGSQEMSSCDSPNTCDGDGNCQDNWLKEGTTCSVPNDFTDTCTIHKCTATGTCAPVKLPDGPLPDGSSCDKPGDMCTFADSCSDGVCTFGGYKNMGTSCFEATFEGDMEATSQCNGANTCDGRGRCLENLELAGTSCDPPQGEANDCVEYECTVSGACEAKNKPMGAICGSQDEFSCNHPDTCDGHGTCLPNHEPEGTSCAVPSEEDDGNECTEYKCTAAGTCEACPVPDEPPADCGEEPPSGSCYERSKCSVGKCMPRVPKASGEQCGSQTDTACDNANTCDGTGTCLHNYEPLGTPCIPDQMDDNDCIEYQCSLDGKCVAVNLDDGTECGPEPSPGSCMERAQCSVGRCQDPLPTAIGVGCGSSDESACDKRDTCDGQGTCLHNFEDVGTLCNGDDGNECTVHKCTVEGTCEPHPLADGTACGTAGDSCKIADSCQSGECVDGGFVLEDTPCGVDGETISFCNQADTCDGKGTCKTNLVAKDVVCGEATSDCMNDDTCDGYGECQKGKAKPLHTTCGDHGEGFMADTACTSPDTCDGEGTCLHNHVANGQSCGDATQCSFGSTCSEGVCEFQGHKPPTTACNEHGPLSGACDAQDYCDGEGACVDKVSDKSTICRPAVDTGCDVLETCDGTNKACPEDTFMAEYTLCGEAMPTDMECDAPDTCNASGECLSRNVPDGTGCGNFPDGDECNEMDSCSSGVCQVGGHKPNTTPCGDFDGAACDVQDHCNAGTCEAKVMEAGTVCREAESGCDVPEKCNGTSKSCPTDMKAALGTPCGKTGADLAYCEIQDTCDGNGGCTDMGEEPVEYSFKCGTTNYLCGDNLSDPEHAATVCNDGVDAIMKIGEGITKAECDELIHHYKNHNNGIINLYGVKCPNRKAVSHYAFYDCKGDYGTKCEAECADDSKDAEGCPRDQLLENCGRCSRRNLRSKLTGFFF